MLSSKQALAPSKRSTTKRKGKGPKTNLRMHPMKKMFIINWRKIKDMELTSETTFKREFLWLKIGAMFYCSLPSWSRENKPSCKKQDTVV